MNIKKSTLTVTLLVGVPFFLGCEKKPSQFEIMVEQVKRDAEQRQYDADLDGVFNEFDREPLLPGGEEQRLTAAEMLARSGAPAPAPNPPSETKQPPAPFVPCNLQTGPDVDEDGNPDHCQVSFTGHNAAQQRRRDEEQRQRIRDQQNRDQERRDEDRRQRQRDGY